VDLAIPGALRAGRLLSLLLLLLSAGKNAATYPGGR
jgi:hypothetical protein